MRLSEPPLQVWVICEESGAIESGHCNCMAGLAESCSHVGATLFALHAATNINKNRSVTDVTAYWKNQVTDKFPNPHGKVSDLDFSSKSKGARQLF